MSTLTGKVLNLVKPALTDDYKVTIGTDLPANFQKIDDEFSAHLADLVTDADGVHDLMVEEGTWTPILAGQTTAGNYSLSTQLGTYRKINNVVTAWFTLTVSNINSAGSGILEIRGLPYVINASQTQRFGVVVNNIVNLPLSTGYTQFTGQAQPGGTKMYLFEIGSDKNALPIQIGVVKVGLSIAGFITYQTA